MTYKHRIRLTGIAYQNEELLLVQHINPRTGRKRWSTPGGGLELTDTDIFRGVEREMLEETGIRVRAGQIRYVNEFFDLYSRTLMLDIWIECHPAESDTFDAISVDNIREDDYIIDVQWWSKTAFLEAGHNANEPLLNPAMWDNLMNKNSPTIHLGRWEE